MITLASSYWGPASYFKILSMNEQIAIETQEHFIKQSFRNRCQIYGANGPLNLSIPLRKWKNNAPINQIKISYEDNWQQVHWKSIESSYRASPFFEFYEEEIKPFYQSAEIESLLEFNQKTLFCILNLIKLKPNISETDRFEKQERDWRIIIQPKNKGLNKTFQFPKYIQVFEDKHGFISNLSILDVLFNLGPQTSNYLNSIATNN